MQYKRIICIGSICVFFAFVSLFLAGGDAWGECTSGQRFDISFVPDYVEQPWSGTHVPQTALPSLFPGAGSYFSPYEGMSCGTPGNWGCQYWCYYAGGQLICPHDGDWTEGNSCDYPYSWVYYMCWNGDSSCVTFGYNACQASGDPYVLDYDCDGTPDSPDADPTSSGDDNRNKNAGRVEVCYLYDANPVNVATGNKYEEVLDISISSPGIPLRLTRSYNSQINYDGPLGHGWTHSYDLSVQVVQETPSKRVIVWDSDGRALYFDEISRNGEIIFSGESGVKDRLKQVVSTGEYFLRRKEGNLTYKFNSDGKLLEISDPNGNSSTLTYTSGLLTQVSDNFGKSLSIQYTNNRISSITDPKSQSISYGYTNGDLTSVTYPDDNSISYAYSNHLLTDKYDTDSNLIGHWGYDGYSRVNNYYSHLKDSVPQKEIDLTYDLGSTLITNSTGTTTYTTGVIDGIYVVRGTEGCSTCGSVNKRIQYSNRLDLTEMTSIEGANEYTTQYVYDNPENPWEQVGEVLEMTEALGKTEERTTTYAYTHRQNDPFLLDEKTETKPSVVSSGQNKVVTITYDTGGNITSREEVGYVLINGTPTQKTYTTEYVYNQNIPGQLLEINGPRASNSTTFEYYDNTQQEGNNRGQLKAIVNALSQRIEFSNYDANGNVGKIKDPNNVETEFTYDERNRVKTIENLTTNALTEYSYDARGNLSSIVLPEGNQIDFTYNLANKLTEIKDSLNNKIQYQYDVEGNRTQEKIKDPQGTLKKQLDFTYDAYNRLKKIINPDASQTYTEYSYDTRGNATSIKDPKNNTTSYVYDALSRLTQINQPLSTTTGQGYDTQDNSSSVTDPRNHTTQYIYDDFGRKNQTTSPDTGTTKYEYDEAGNLTKRVDANGTTVNYTYDALNRLTGIDFPGTAEDVAFTYDSTSVTYGKGRLTGRTDPSGSYTFYYDAHGNLTKEEKTIETVQYTTEYAYNNDNNLTSITYPSGREVTHTLDVTGRITQVDTTLNSNPKTLASSISYLPYGGITGLTYGNSLSLSHGYDNQYRSSSIVVDPVLDRTYEYDANGNVTSLEDDEAAGNEALETPGIYTYDQYTNLLADITWGQNTVVYDYDDNANTVSTNNRTYVYDSSNQLIEVWDNANQIAGYTYNGAGQRIEKVTQSGTKIFHYDLKGHLIAETDDGGDMIAKYVYLGDQLLAMITKPAETEIVSYFHNDHLGTPLILTNDNETIVWKAAYTPFGGADISVQTVENPFRLPGQYYDPETGLHYNYFRYYNPQTGRYITPDPIGLEGGINLFAYVENNPVNWVDPEGLIWGQLLQRIVSHPYTQRALLQAQIYAQRGLFYAQIYGQRALDLAKNLLQRGGACYKGEGGVIMLGRFQEYKAGLETFAKRYGARILDKPFPKGVQLPDALRAEIDAAEKIYFRWVGVGPGSISYDIEWKYIQSNPELMKKTIHIFE